MNLSALEVQIVSPSQLLLCPCAVCPILPFSSQQILRSLPPLNYFLLNGAGNDTLAPPDLKQPLEPTVSVIGELEQKLSLMASVSYPPR